MPQGSAPMANEDGSVLIVALIILMVVSLLGVAGMRSSTTEENMTGHWKSRNIAFQAAEVALRAGEDRIESAASRSALDDGGGWYLMEGEAAPDYTDASNWTTTSSAQIASSLDQVTQQPRYIIKYMGDTGSQGLSPGGGGAGVTVDLFTVTAIGYGSSPGTRVVLQSTYARDF